MAHGSPDWTRTVQVVISEAQAKDEQAAGDVGRYPGSDTTYQTVVDWTVAAGKIGELKEVSMITNNYDKTLWKLVIGTVTLFEDITIQAALTLPFNDLRLAAGTTVALSCKSLDGTSIVVDGSIVGKEVG